MIKEKKPPSTTNLTEIAIMTIVSTKFEFKTTPESLGYTKFVKGRSQDVYTVYFHSV